MLQCEALIRQGLVRRVFGEWQHLCQERDWKTQLATRDNEIKRMDREVCIPFVIIIIVIMIVVMIIREASQEPARSVSSSGLIAVIITVIVIVTVLVVVVTVVAIVVNTDFVVYGDCPQCCYFTSISCQK